MFRSDLIEAAFGIGDRSGLLTGFRFLFAVDAQTSHLAVVSGDNVIPVTGAYRGRSPHVRKSGRSAFRCKPEDESRVMKSEYPSGLRFFGILNASDDATS